jgi:alkanesulfonate monooxygenase SsuD/methylene tetrahydromethanopterin reductase-like flavin-dependent oxidoreductase (luciferase family)
MGSVTDITVSVQAEPTDLRSWLALARRLESAGFGALLLGDHPGSGASPWPALGSAAAVTQTLTLGTYVIQAGVREPVHVAADAASLDVLARGGSGWASAPGTPRASGKTSGGTGQSRGRGPSGWPSSSRPSPGC